MKSILVDLSALKEPDSGLGQIALSYLKYFKKYYDKDNSNFRLTLLLPDELIGSIGDKVDYISSTRWKNKRFQFLLPKFDVWHATHQLNKFMPKSAKTKFIYTVHDLNYLYEKKGIPKFLKNRKIQRKVNRADKITCISNFTKNEIVNNLKLNRKACQVIYNQVKKIDKSKAKQPNIKIIKPYFFALGVIKNSKNFHVLLDLMKLMPNKHLYIAGKENKTNSVHPYATMMRKRIKDEKINNVTMLGQISHNHKVWFYQHCEAVFLPSLLEGFGLPMIESMQFGKPVFSSDATCLPEIGDKYAFYWENFDPEYMKKIIDDNLENFYNDPDLIKKQIAYAESFDSNKHFEEYIKIYETI